ncbi:MAG: ribosome recycling factor [Deltaproteobacteria bacterium GWA2_38_16]|nr:MAG: ribosome recycling factor [Deltaproteobacteria bacterium GWA2_38_16]OGQ02833.1 MAG: ribosome recycling factor [Deltaproteobacteria bacterium RIFCSPHIGHO2_02_FULL_38_15]OGQ60350.1 MAG: ribosome recycling factor [Deltaproteobacteria bacterium RIFCSPLOWO2_12_FULL_38_8]
MDMNQIQLKMQKTLDNLKSELAKLRTGRATPTLLDTVMVDYYGNMTALKNMATISAPEARLLTIQPWDASQIQAIEKAIQMSDLGLTPNNDGKIIRIQLPPLTEERRKELVKLVKKVGEDGKVSIRLIRRDANDDLKKENLPEDDLRKSQNQIQKMTDEQIQKIDSLLVTKEKDILHG